MNKVISFLLGHDIDIPNIEYLYVSQVAGIWRMIRSKAPCMKKLYHYQVEVYLSVIELRLQELENQFE